MKKVICNEKRKQEVFLNVKKVTIWKQIPMALFAKSILNHVVQLSLIGREATGKFKRWKAINENREAFIYNKMMLRGIFLLPKIERMYLSSILNNE